MNPTTMQTSRLVEEVFNRGLHAQSGGNLDFREFDTCIDAAALAIANADRALRRLPPVTHVSHLHPTVFTVCQDAAMRAVLEQHPAARVEAFADTGDELQRFVEKLLEDPDKRAICHDAEMMKDACCAMVRVMSSTYRKSLNGQMGVLRSADGE
jgi:hypothetical protein